MAHDSERQPERQAERSVRKHLEHMGRRQEYFLRVLLAVYRQNDEILDLLVDTQPDPSKLDPLTARVKAVRDALTKAIADNSPEAPAS